MEQAALIRLSESEFTRLRDFIYRECGINLSPAKRILLESRLRKRLDHLRLASYAAYCDYVMSPTGAASELVHMIDAVATNKTDFFREPVHFQFMEQEVIPHWFEYRSASAPFKVWSSACSTGEEPYTIAMVLQNLATQYGFDYRITASDISTRVLQKAATAVYAEHTASAIPLNMRKQYLLRSKDTATPTVRVGPLLRSKVQFKRLNLIEDVLEVEPGFDLIFCRNLLIYFDRATQENVLRRLLTKLKPGGYLFIGHSESIYQMDLPLRQLRPTIFQLQSA
jgi:chemotaxis protein methyltransferase CheR